MLKTNFSGHNKICGALPPIAQWLRACYTYAFCKPMLFEIFIIWSDCL